MLGFTHTIREKYSFLILYILLLIFIAGFLLCFAFLNKSGISFNKIKSALSNASPFTAAITPNPLSSENLTPGVEGKELGVETKAKEPETTLPLVFSKKAGSLVEIQEMLDDIAERIDIMSQEIAELTKKTKVVFKEISDETEESIEELEEDKEREEIGQKEEEVGQKEEEDICSDGINVNTASKKKLKKITGVGLIIAQRIIEARPFSSIYDLTRVSGIGEKTLQSIIEQGCAYVEGDIGSGGSGSIFVSGNRGGGTSPLPAVTYPEILISEVKIAEKTGDKNVFIELYNQNDFETDLTNWYIFRNDKSFITKTLLKEKKIPPKEHFLLVRKDSENYSEKADVFFEETLNEDDKIALKNPNGEVVDEISWSQIPSGFSLGRKWDGQGYGDFEIQTPTPKAENSQITPIQPILEVFPEIMEFSIIEFDTEPESKIFTISNKGEGILEWDSVIEYDSFSFEGINWLTIEPEFGMISADTPSEVLIFPDISNLAKGIYTAQIIISAENAEESPKEIEVILTVVENVLEDTIPPEVIFSLEPVQTSLSFMLSWTATDPIGSATPSGLEAFYLQYSVILPIPPGNVAIVQYQNQAGEMENWPILGDLNNDQNVNFVDYAIFSSFWMNQDCAEPGWCEGADFDKDGQVNIFDLGVFESHWLRKDIGEVVLDSQKTNLNVLGEDEYTYSFRIRAKDKAGNLSEWKEAITTINLPKKVLINEIQIDSQIGAGGTNDDWVELYNPNEWEIDLSQWSIQRSPKSGTIYKKNFEPDHKISANGYFLIVRNNANQDLLNIADMTCSVLQLSFDHTVYLVKNQEEVENGEDLDIIDKVGFGEEAFSPEGNPAPNPPEEKSIERKELGIDTNDNKQDFEIIDIPTPTNSNGEG